LSAWNWIFGIPEGLKVDDYRSSFSLESQSGVWHSGPLNAWAIRDMNGAEPWLVLGVDPDFYRLNARWPVKLTVDCALTLIRHLSPQFHVNGNVADIAGFGQCRGARTSTGAYVTDCLSPVFRPRSWENTISLTFPAVPVVPSFDALYATNESLDWTAPNLREITIEVPVARNIRMADYEVTSPRYEGGRVAF